MTPTEMEDAIKNCSTRLSAVEEFLPTLATREDLRASETRISVIVESLRDDIHKVAEGYAEHEIMLKALPRIADTVASHTITLDALTYTVTAHTVKLDVLADTVGSHTVKLDAIGIAIGMLTDRLGVVSDRLGSLTDRLEQKGVI